MVLSSTSDRRWWLVARCSWLVRNRLPNRSDGQTTHPECGRCGRAMQPLAAGSNASQWSFPPAMSQTPTPRGQTHRKSAVPTSDEPNPNIAGSNSSRWVRTQRSVVSVGPWSDEAVDHSTLDRLEVLRARPRGGLDVTRRHGGGECPMLLGRHLDDVAHLGTVDLVGEQR